MPDGVLDACGGQGRALGTGGSTAEHIPEPLDCLPRRMRVLLRWLTLAMPAAAAIAGKCQPKHGALGGQTTAAAAAAPFATN